MKRYYIFILSCLCLSLNVKAQDNRNLNIPHGLDVETQKHLWQQMVADTTKSENLADSSKPVVQAPSIIQSYAYGLHPGLNASVGVSAFATFGKNVPHHGGFGQDINLSYLTPLTKDGKLWLDLGGYFNNTTWGGDSYRDVGLYGILGYKFDEHWEGFVYGQLSISNNYDNLWNRYGYYGYSPYCYGYPIMGYSPLYYGMGTPMGYGMGMSGANVIGAGVKYNVNKNFSIGVSFQGVWYDNNPHRRFFEHYSYPAPQDAN